MQFRHEFGSVLLRKLGLKEFCRKYHRELSCGQSINAQVRSETSTQKEYVWETFSDRRGSFFVMVSILLTKSTELTS